MADSTDSRVEEHYTHRDLAAAIFEALAAAGKDVDNLTLQDLAPVDEFHVRGQEATAELARSARLDETVHVLDVGSGVGGPSRYLAAEFGCRVTGLDLTQEYCRTAQVLADRPDWATASCTARVTRSTCRLAMHRSRWPGPSIRR